MFFCIDLGCGSGTRNRGLNFPLGLRKLRRCQTTCRLKTSERCHRMSFNRDHGGSLTGDAEKRFIDSPAAAANQSPMRAHNSIDRSYVKHDITRWRSDQTQHSPIQKNFRFSETESSCCDPDPIVEISAINDRTQNATQTSRRYPDGCVFGEKAFQLMNNEDDADAWPQKSCLKEFSTG